jgi:hypothetical protein
MKSVIALAVIALTIVGAWTISGGDHRSQPGDA